VLEAVVDQQLALLELGVRAVVVMQVIRELLAQTELPILEVVVEDTEQQPHQAQAVQA
jgi:hypothetical protein